MARRILDNERFLKYHTGDGQFAVWKYNGSVSIKTEGEGVEINPRQARHIAKKLNQFADDFEGK